MECADSNLDYFENKLENSLIKFPTSPSNWFSSLLELVSFSIKFLAWFKALFNSLGAWFTSPRDVFLAWFKALFNSLGAWFTSPRDVFLAWFKALFNSLGAWFTSPRDVFLAWFKALFNSLGAWFTSPREVFLAWFKALFNSLRSLVYKSEGSIFSLVNSLIVYIISSYILGIDYWGQSQQGH